MDESRIKLSSNLNYDGRIVREMGPSPVDVIETVSPEGTFCDTVHVPSRGGDMELI